MELRTVKSSINDFFRLLNTVLLSHTTRAVQVLSRREANEHTTLRTKSDQSSSLCFSAPLHTQQVMATPCRLRLLPLLLGIVVVAVAASHPGQDFCAAAGGGAGAGCGGGGGGDGTRILVKGGTVVNADRAEEADVYVEDGVVVAVRPNIPVGDNNVKVIDATGKYVLPGGIDPHTHLEMEFLGTVTIDDFFSGHAAALAGGTTMHIDFCHSSEWKLNCGFGILQTESRKIRHGLWISHGHYEVE